MELGVLKPDWRNPAFVERITPILNEAFNTNIPKAYYAEKVEQLFERQNCFQFIIGHTIVYWHQRSNEITYMNEETFAELATLTPLAHAYKARIKSSPSASFDRSLAYNVSIMSEQSVGMGCHRYSKYIARTPMTITNPCRVVCVDAGVDADEPVELPPREAMSLNGREEEEEEGFVFGEELMK
ncbi:hypothetical protein C2S52_023668 [Perilla frutescens var. hirtella]|nr:hypothetical protein C2S52_023668 [Perilla frutescens var. hirtella]